MVTCTNRDVINLITCSVWHSKGGYIKIWCPQAGMTSCGTLWGISVKSVLTEMTSACHWAVGKAGLKYQCDLNHILPTENTVKKFSSTPATTGLTDHLVWLMVSATLNLLPQYARTQNSPLQGSSIADHTVSKRVSELTIQDKRETSSCVAFLTQSHQTVTKALKKS